MVHKSQHAWVDTANCRPVDGVTPRKSTPCREFPKGVINVREDS